MSFPVPPTTEMGDSRDPQP